MSRKILVIALLVVLAAVAWLVYEEQQKVAHPPSKDIIAYGNVDIRDVALGFRVSGRIAALHYEEGDRVKAGVVLAVLDKQPFTDDLALYQAELDEAEVLRRKVEKPFERRAALTKIGAISKEERDDAEAARDEGVARVNTATARLRQAETRLRDTELIAPNDGIILTRVREPGAVVAVGEPVYSLALDNPVWVRTYVSEPRLGDVHPGQKALVLTDSGGRYEGWIGFISPQAEFTPKTVETAELRTDLVYRLRVIVNAPDNGLRQGMPVTVHILSEPNE